MTVGFGALVSQGLNFLGSAGGQQLLGSAGQLFKVKELGYQGPQGIAAPGLVAGPGVAGPGAFEQGVAIANVVGNGGNGGAGGNALIPAGVAGAGRALANQFGGRVVELAGNAMLERWGRAQNMEVQGVDIITMGQPDDRESAKLAVKHGVIPADSDFGQMLQMGGAKVTVRGVKMSDGSTIRMRVVTAVGARKRKRRNYATAAGIRNASRTLRQMGQIVRTYKGLAKLGSKIDNQLSPKRSSARCCPPKRKKAC